MYMYIYIHVHVYVYIYCHLTTKLNSECLQDNICLSDAKFFFLPHESCGLCHCNNLLSCICSAVMPPFLFVWKLHERRAVTHHPLCLQELKQCSVLRSLESSGLITAFIYCKLVFMKYWDLYLWWCITWNDMVLQYLSSISIECNTLLFPSCQHDLFGGHWRNLGQTFPRNIWLDLVFKSQGPWTIWPF